MLNRQNDPPNKEELELQYLEETTQAAKKRAAEDLAYQKKQIEQIKQAEAWYWLSFRATNVILHSLITAGQSISLLGKIFPPLNAFVSGVSFVIDLVEVIFLSEETRNRKAVRIANSAAVTGLTIAAAVMSINPVTAPLGLALAASAMAVASVKEAFFWYKAKKDLRIAENNLTKTTNDFYLYIKANYPDQTSKINDINVIDRKINLIKQDRELPKDQQQARLSLLNKAKRAAMQEQAQINKDDPFILATHQKIISLQNEVETKRIILNETRRNFFLNVASCVGTALFAVSALFVATALVANPIGLAILGGALIGAAAIFAIKNKFFPKKPEIISKKTAPKDAPTPDLPQDDIEEGDRETNKDSDKEHLQSENTVRIAHQLALGSHQKEKEILKQDIVFYHNLDVKSPSSPKSRPSSPLTQPAPSTTPSPPNSSDDDEVHLGNK